MEIKEAVNLLEHHNEWRIGTGIEKPDFSAIEEAIDTIVKYTKEKENIKDEVNRIIISFEDLAFEEYFAEAGKTYCTLGNKFLKNFEYTKIREELIKRFTDINYIKSYFTNNVIGNYIKNYSDNNYWIDLKKYDYEIVDITFFNKVKGHVEYLVSKTKMLTTNEFENILKYNDGSMDNMRLIIEFDNNKFDSYIL